MALTVILVLYLAIGVLAAAGSVFLVRKILSPGSEQAFFALFLLPIAGFYLAFTAYFHDDAAWGLETTAVIVFAVLGLLGVRWPIAIALGYLLHGTWDVLHEMEAHAGLALLGDGRLTEIPLAYGAFCLAYDGSVAGYFLARLSGARRG